MLDGEFLILEGRSVLVIEPPKLLKNLCVTGVISDDAFVGILRAGMLEVNG